MRALLDVSSQRIIQILDTVFINNDWITIHDLSKITGASKRTISDDIDTLRKRWGEYLNIEVSTKKGIKVNNKNSSVIGRILVDIFNDSTALKWLEEILFYPNNNIEFYEKKLFVSRSTLIRLLPKINSYLAKCGMTVQSKLNRYSIVSKDEQYLRQFYTGFLIELHGLELNKYKNDFDFKILINIIINSVCKNLDTIQSSVVIGDEITILYYTAFYFVSLIRENQGYTIPSSYNAKDEVSAEEFEYIKNYFSNIDINNLNGVHKTIHKQYLGWDSEEEKTLVTYECKMFFERIFDATNIHPDPSMLSKLNFSLSSFYFSIKTRPVDISSLFDRVQYFSDSVKEYNYSVYSIIKDNLMIFSKNIKMDVTPRIKNVIFWTLMSIPELINYIPPKKALIISDFGIQHAEFLSCYISNYINTGNLKVLNIDIFNSSTDSSEINNSDYDMIITTIPNLSTQKKPIILINDYPNQQDMRAIYKFLQS